MDLYFNVSQLMREPSGSLRTYEVDETLQLVENAPPSRLQGSVRLMKADKGIWVSARLKSEMLCACSRCLIEYAQPLVINVEEEAFQLIDAFTGARLAHQGSLQEGTFIDQNHILDLREAVSQYATLSIPMKPVCRADCAGMCPSCGANLNEATCSCGRLPGDRRWHEIPDKVTTNRNSN